MARRNRATRPPRTPLRQLVTPEGVPLDLRLGSAGARAGAFIIDALIMIAILIGVTLLLVAGLLEGFGRQLIRDDTARLAIGGTMLMLWTLYFTFGGRRGTP